MLENPVYTGRLFWNRLDFRAVKQGEGPLVRRSPEEWIEASDQHEALISKEQFDQVQTEMNRRRRGTASPLRRTTKRFYLLRGFIHCATGHNALRMQGKSRKDNTYYACGYRIDYGDKAAEALGHGKWQYVNEKVLVPIVDAFFATRIFGPQRLEHFRSQGKSLSTAVNGKSDEKRQRLQKIVSDIDTRLDRQIAAIEAGVDPAVVAERIRQLESKREEARDRLSDLEGNTPTNGGDPEDALAVLQEMPDLSKALVDAEPELRREVFDAFRLRIELDRNAGQIRLKALVSSESVGVLAPFLAPADPACFDI